MRSCRLRGWPPSASAAVTFLGIVALSSVVTGAAVTAQERPAFLRRFELSTAPTLMLADDGSEERQFVSILVRRMPSGRLVVGEPEAGRVRVFGRDGSVRRVLARKGNGPGELPGIFTMGLTGDTVMAFGQPPFSPNAVYYFNEATGYTGHVGSDALGASSLSVVERLSSVSFLVRRTVTRALRTAPQTGRLYPDTATFGILSLATSDRATVTWLPPIVRHWTFAHAWPGGPIATRLFRYPFAPMTFVIASADRVWIIDATDGSLRPYDTNGAALKPGRLAGSPRRFDGGVLESRREAVFAEARSPLDSARASAMFERQLLPATMPWISAALPGPDGEIWLRLFDPSITAAQAFVVVDRYAKEIAEVSVPPNVDVQHIGREFLLGVQTMPDGTFAIVEYAVRR